MRQFMLLRQDVEIHEHHHRNDPRDVRIIRRRHDILRARTFVSEGDIWQRLGSFKTNCTQLEEDRQVVGGLVRRWNQEERVVGTKTEAREEAIASCLASERKVFVGLTS